MADTTVRPGWSVGTFFSNQHCNPALSRNGEGNLSEGAIDGYRNN